MVPFPGKGCGVMRNLPILVLSLVLCISQQNGVHGDADKPTTSTALSAEQIQQLIDQLGDDSFDIREKASKRLVELGKPVLAALRKAAADSKDPEIRLRAQKALNDIESSPRYLIEDLKDKNPTVRAKAAEGLGRLGQAAKPAIPMLSELMKDSDESVREAAMVALINIDPKLETIAKLIPAKASAEGKYKTLLRCIKVPQDRTNYKDYCDYGRFDGNSWAGHNDLPPGYWVYVYPHWFIWGDMK